MIKIYPLLKRYQRLLIIFSSALFFFVLITFSYFFYFIQAPLNFKQDEIIFDLAYGTPLRIATQQLIHKNILTKREGLSWLIWIKWMGKSTHLQAGEYAIQPTLTPKSLLKKFLKGDVVQHTITLIEGSTFAQVRQILSKHGALKQTLSDKTSTDIMQLLGSEIKSPEGMFLADTYHFPRGTSDFAVMKRAYQLMQRRLIEVWETRDSHCHLKNSYEALILASLIEKETAKPWEYEIIAGVFQRRLQKSMRLQCDPTVIYGLGDNITKLTKATLKFDTPYNTYLHKGLPPTPIALPSLKALKASVHPDSGEALFFVANHQGGHTFSATLEAHNIAVKEYLSKKELLNAPIDVR